MHLSLRLVNESGDSIVEQVFKEGFQSMEVGPDICGISDRTNNPNTTGKPQSIQTFPCVF
jgi:hypothetical protein